MNRYCFGLTVGVLAAAGTASADIVTSDPYLAGPLREYRQTNPPAHFLVGGSFFDVFFDLDVQSPTQPVPPAPYYGPPLGTTELRESPTRASLHLSVSGAPQSDALTDGLLIIRYATASSGVFDTEMLALDLHAVSPIGPFMIRESPTRASLGRSVVTPAGGGLFRIDSFFDVFTELSIDGGQTWIPDSNNGPVHVVLPAPGAAALLGLGGLMAARRRRA